MKKMFLILFMASFLGLVNKILFNPGMTFFRYEIDKYNPEVNDGADDECPIPLDLASPQEINLDVAKCFYDKGVSFLDARDEEIFLNGTIKGSINIPFNDFDPGYVEDYYIDQDVLYVIFCDGGECTLGADLAEVLFELGYTNLLLYEGGYPEWERNQYPINVVEL